jgi:protoheme IX farnesyltransferase
MYREEYGQAGFPMLPVIEPDGKRAGRQALVYAAALLPISLVPTLAGATGWLYFWTALPLGAALLVLAARFAMNRTENSARQLFLGSITYLPLVLLAMVLAH